MDDGSEVSEIPKHKKSLEHVLGHRYTVADGLAGMQVEAIYQDRQGLLWIATADGGISRFDGTRFDTFGRVDGIPHLTVMAIAEAEDGRLFFGTLGGGLAAYDGQSFQVYTIEDGLPCNDILGLQQQPDGTMRILTGNGVGWFSKGRVIESLTAIGGQPIGRVYDMATDSAGTTWLATLKWGVISLDGRRMSMDFRVGTGTGHWTWKFAEDAAGYLWIAFHYIGSEAVIGRYDPQQQQFDLIDVGSELEDEKVVRHGMRDVRLDERGWLWVARKGVLVYDGQDWRSFSVGLPGFPFADTRLTYEDREGNIWVGLWGGGLVFCDLVRVQRYTEADGLLDREVRCLAEDREGRIWIGTAGGLACLEDDQLRPVATGRALSALVVDQQGHLWSGGPDGRVFKGTGQETQVIEVAEGRHEEIAGLFLDRRGRMSVCTSEGRFGRIGEDRFTAFEEPFSYPCRAVLQDEEGVFWIGTHGKRPVLYSYKDGHFRALDIVGLEAVSYVNALYEHEGTLWVGTAQGLFAFDFHSKQVRQFTVEEGGLSTNGILALGVDRQGRLWIGTNGGGVLNYDGRTFHPIRLGKSAPMNTIESILCDSQGRLWFGTKAGLVAYQPCDVPPSIAIRPVVEGRLVESSQAASYIEGTDEIVIHFQGIRFGIAVAPMRYRHRLVGYGPAAEWSATALDDKVSYRGVPVGEYRFEVRTQDQDGLESEVASLEVRVVADDPDKRRTPGILSQSPVMAQLLKKVEQVAATNTGVLVLGETGAGKGLLARTIHTSSPRREQAFIAVNCGALPPGLVESELFGHEKGAFTNAIEQRIGFFEQAHGGTLFLDEIGDLPLEAQRVLLNVLEEDRLTRVGGKASILVDVRIIAATNRDLQRAVREGTFRADLYYRLTVFPLVVPPLRERREDIPVLAAHFVRQYAQRFQRPVPTLGDEVMEYLQAHTWPGNVRELAHRMQRAVIVCEGERIKVIDVLSAGVEEPRPASASPVEQEDEDEDEKQRIVEALERTNWMVSGERGAARLLGMTAQTLRYRMRKYEVQRPKKSS